MAVEEARGLVVTTGQSAGGMTVDEQEVRKNAVILMNHKGTGVFPSNMTAAEAGQIARLALAYGLDPFVGELILYQNRPYVTIDGRIRVANSHPAFRGIECRPATDEERKDFRCRDNEHLWKATVWRSDRDIPTAVFGRASDDDGNPVSKKWAQEMAQKRAKHRALRDAFSIPIPGREEAGDHDSYESRPRISVIDAEATEVIDATIMATPEQVTAIHALVGALKWSDEEYRAVLQQTYHVGSSKDLAEGQAASVLEMLHILEEQGNAAAFLERFKTVKEAVEARTGKTLAEIAWDDGELTPRPLATTLEPPPLASTLEPPPWDDAPAPEEPPSEPDGEPLFVACTAATKAKLLEVAGRMSIKPSIKKQIEGTDWAKLSEGEAAMWLESLT